MSFKNKLLLCAGLPALAFILALCLLGWTMQRTNAAFNHYIAQDQAVDSALRDMYAQGLQMGQALRNIVLDPQNKQAYGNFKNAQEQFQKSLDQMGHKADTGEMSAAIQSLNTLRDKLGAQQRAVMDAVGSDIDAATHLLVTAETPAWRELRAALLKLIDEHAKASEANFTANQGWVQKLGTASAVLAAMALAVSVVATASLLRTTQTELGGEPSHLRAAMEALAGGDLTTRLHSSPARAGEAHSLAAAINKTIDQLKTTLVGVQESARSLASVSSEIEQGNLDLSARTEQTASNLEQTAASMEELSATVKQAADAAEQANRLAEAAGQTAQQGGAVVGQVVQTMQEISDASRRIHDIIGVIDGIAFQTNILALNAAVEAARAGEQGRGFAVVAGEVRNLAQRSAQAAQEIKVLISDSVDKVAQGAELVNNAGTIMSDVVQSVSRVSGVIGEVATATAEQADGVRQINAAVDNLDQMTQQNAALVEQSAAGASSIKEQIDRLSHAVSVFRIDTTPRLNA